MILEDHETELFHYGTLHKSGRYPWGSGSNPNQRNQHFVDYVKDLKSKGMSDKDIATGLGLTMNQFRANKTIVRHEIKQDKIEQARKLKEKGMSTTAIGVQMNLNESSVRDLLSTSVKEKNDLLVSTANMLQGHVTQKV